mmetsp:Transcript_2516/g.16624  ORF Transcript_2516/g.16624 Transcript_2516/m.16624 type:complete len:311 (+) Transcript_2516:1115-2047(+)
MRHMGVFVRSSAWKWHGNFSSSRVTFVRKAADGRRPGADARLLLDAYSDLGLDHEVYSVSGGVRTRQHVNPLKRELQQPPPEVDWSRTFDDAKKPLVVDVGCGPGRFLLSWAKQDSQGLNYLGIDIRNPIIDRANRWSHELHLCGSVHFVLGNGTLFLDQVLKNYPGPVHLVCIQFPDPHFKKKHKKRRIVQPGLCEQLKSILPLGGLFFFQTDVEEVALDAREIFVQHLLPEFSFHPAHARTSGDQAIDVVSIPQEERLGSDHNERDVFDVNMEEDPWLGRNPLGIWTEREVATLHEGKPVYRMLLQKR